MLLKYKGSRDARSITQDEFAAIIPDMGGPIDHETVVWDGDNLYTAEVKTNAADWLMENYPGQFEKTTKKEHEEELKAATEEDVAEA